jgi:nucleoside-diphosphate-sugar epimerase
MRLALEAPAERVNKEIINIGADDQNYTVLQIARTVARLLPEARLSFAEGATSDRRSYRVHFRKVRTLLPGFRCRFNLRSGIEDLLENFRRVKLESTDRFVRLAALQGMLGGDEVDSTLRPREQMTSPP